MTQRQRYRLEQFALAFVLSAAGLVYAAALIARRFDHPDFRAVTR